MSSEAAGAGPQSIGRLGLMEPAPGMAGFFFALIRW